MHLQGSGKIAFVDNFSVCQLAKVENTRYFFKKQNGVSKKVGIYKAMIFAL